MKKRNVVIAGGGTGGHIYPGLALSDYLKEHHPEIQVHFVGARGGLEESIIPRSGHPLHLLTVERLHHSVSLARRLKSLLLLPWSFVQSLVLYLKLRPLWVLGVGGFASGPFVFMASLLGGRTGILEPNAHPGLANRLLARWVKLCFVVFREAGAHFSQHKVKKVGLPVRLSKKRPKFDYNSGGSLKILIFGGSQGSRAINKVIGDWVETLPKDHGYEVVHQIGARDIETWNKRYGDRHTQFLTYMEYIHDMPQKLEWADLVICRAGIGSVAELAMSGKPALFVPLPSAADNHQYKNAKVLADQKAALLLEEKEFTVQALAALLERLKREPSKLAEIMERLKDVDYSDAQAQIIETLMDRPNGN